MTRIELAPGTEPIAIANAEGSLDAIVNALRKSWPHLRILPRVAATLPPVEDVPDADGWNTGKY